MVGHQTQTSWHLENSNSPRGDGSQRTMDLEPVREVDGGSCSTDSDARRFSLVFRFLGSSFVAGKPAIGGPWSLVDLDGNLVTNVSFQGKWLLLYFGFARCPDICPSEMLKIARVIDQLKETHPNLAEKIVPVFVSVDPARDSLTALKEYSKDFHPDYVFLTGSPSQVQQMAKKYRVYVSKADETEDGDYLVDHSIVVYFHDDKGELSDCFTQSMRPKDISEKIVEKMTAPQTMA